MADIQTKKLITLRLAPELLERIDARAAKLGWSRTRFLEWAAGNGLDDAEWGVPDPPGRPRQLQHGDRIPARPVRALPLSRRGRAEDGDGGPSFRDESVVPEQFVEGGYDRWRIRRDRWRGNDA